ncbi:HERC1, partial [Symbiodinium microadriaticum]
MPCSKRKWKYWVVEQRSGPGPAQAKTRERELVSSQTAAGGVSSFRSLSHSFSDFISNFAPGGDCTNVLETRCSPERRRPDRRGAAQQPRTQEAGAGAGAGAGGQSPDPEPEPGHEDVSVVLYPEDMSIRAQRAPSVASKPTAEAEGGEQRQAAYPWPEDAPVRPSSSPKTQPEEIRQTASSSQSPKHARLTSSGNLRPIGSERRSAAYDADPEDLLDQHVAYYLRHHKDVAAQHSVNRLCPGVYAIDDREVRVEWQHALEPGGQGFLVVVDGPLRQPFADYMEHSENNAEYDVQGRLNAGATSQHATRGAGIGTERTKAGNQEEPDLEDHRLNEELAALAALRAQREKEVPPSRGRSTPRATPRAQVRAAGGAGGATADALLSRAEQAGTTVDREIEEMDRELQRQVAEFRKQQRRDSQPGCEEPSPEAEAPAPCPPSLLEPENAELRELKDLAAKMDEAFPEGEGAAPQPPSAADEAPDAEPEDTEVSEFKNLLDQLDLRLRALQSKEALKLPLDEAPASVVPKAVTETLESLRSQNRYLREQLSSERRKGRLDLDRQHQAARLPSRESLHMLTGDVRIENWIGVDTSLHSIPREKRMSFHDTHKVYSRLEAMKVAKEQALVRERAADYTKDGREVPRELLSKYKKQVALKLDQSGQRRKGERRTSGMENPKPAPPALEPPPAAGTNGQRLPQAPPPGNPPANPPAAAGIPTMPGLPAAHYAWPPPGQGGPTPRMPQTTTGFTGAYQPYGLPAQGQTPGRGDGLPRYPLPPGPSLFTPPSLSPPVGFPPPVLPQSAAVPPSVDQKDQMQKLFEEVLQKQHNALILRLESWLSKLDSKLDELPPRAISDWARQATPAPMTNRLSNRSTRSRQNEDPDKVEEKPQRRSIHSEDYELAQSEADRIESMKNLAMASRQTSKTRTKLQSWARKMQQKAAKLANSLAFNVFFGM